MCRGGIPRLRFFWILGFPPTLFFLHIITLNNLLVPIAAWPDPGMGEGSPLGYPNNNSNWAAFGGRGRLRRLWPRPGLGQRWARPGLGQAGAGLGA